MTSQTVSEVIEDAVREALRPKVQTEAARDRLPVFGGSGVLPGIDLSNAAGLVDEMDLGEVPDALR